MEKIVFAVKNAFIATQRQDFVLIGIFVLKDLGLIIVTILNGKEKKHMCLGLATGCIKPKEERTTLLKPYTNNDKLTDISIEERAKLIDQEPWCDGNCTEVDECKDCIIDFLKKEAK